MLPDRVSNPGPLTYETGALPITLRGPAQQAQEVTSMSYKDLALRSERRHVTAGQCVWSAFVAS